MVSLATVQRQFKDAMNCVHDVDSFRSRQFLCVFEFFYSRILVADLVCFGLQQITRDRYLVPPFELVAYGNAICPENWCSKSFLEVTANDYRHEWPSWTAVWGSTMMLTHSHCWG